MKELSIEEKARAYDEAIENMRKFRNALNNHEETDLWVLKKEIVTDIEYYFPELKESDDDEIRKELLRIVKENKGSIYISLTPRKKSFLISLLEKKGGQNDSDVKDYNSIDPHFGKPIDKVEPKFKVGDWIIDKESKEVFYISKQLANTYEIIDIEGNDYHVPHYTLEEDYDVWSLNDAKEGDVLAYVTDEEDLWIMIYWSLYKPYEGHVHYHALLANDNFSDKGTCCICINDLKPATKEQRDLLFQKIKEVGYEWDAEKKELKKVGQKPAWSEEDENEVAILEAYIRSKDWSERHIDRALGIVDELVNKCKSSKDRVQPQPKQGEQALVLRDTFGYEDGRLFGMNEGIGLVLDNPEKYGLQKPVKWSKEDESVISLILSICKDFLKSFEISPASTKVVKEDIDKIKNWLKSLKERYTWKPSDKQMDALLFVVQHYTPKVTDKLAWDSIKILELMYYEIKQ